MDNFFKVKFQILRKLFYFTGIDTEAHGKVQCVRTLNACVVNIQFTDSQIINEPQENQRHSR